MPDLFEDAHIPHCIDCGNELKRDADQCLVCRPQWDDRNCGNCWYGGGSPDDRCKHCHDYDEHHMLWVEK